MTDLGPYFKGFDILSDTAAQVIKDFGMAGTEIKFSGEPEKAYAELFSQILPLIEKLQKENFQNFYSLMYRIDINEEQIRKEVAQAIDKSFTEVVTGLVLKRELLKVVTRNFYSAGKEI